MNVYDFSAKTLQGADKSLADYKGNVLLIVNTASKCGLTPQYKGLQELYEAYREQGLEILGFPCNQFMQQEPGTNEEIAQFCEGNYGVSFPMFAKIEVNGPHTHPLYQYLKDQAPEGNGEEIEWNFAKFLVDREGNVRSRFSPRTEPADLKADIESLLA